MSDILKRADQIAGKDRSRDYGHPRENFGRIADYWNTYLANRECGLACQITPYDVGFFMILMKIARHQNTEKEDNLLDMAGYVKCLHMLGPQRRLKQQDSDCNSDCDAVQPEIEGQSVFEPEVPPAKKQAGNPNSFWYLATPYRAYKASDSKLDLKLDQFHWAFEAAAEQAAMLVDNGIHVYSPILHSHPIASFSTKNGKRSDSWVEISMRFLEQSRGVIVCMLPGWGESKGIAAEMARAHELEIPVHMMQPGMIPPSDFSDVFLSHPIAPSPSSEIHPCPPSSQPF